MPNFAYRGRDAGGNIAQGVLEGASSAAVADALVGRGIIPLSISPAASGAVAAKAVGTSTELEFFKPKVQHQDVLMFTKQIYTLLKSGVPITSSQASASRSNARTQGFTSSRASLQNQTPALSIGSVLAQKRIGSSPSPQNPPTPYEVPCGRQRP